MPSKALMEEMGEAETTRLASQVQQLGPEGLASKQTELEQAIQQNEVINVHDQP